MHRLLPSTLNVDHLISDGCSGFANILVISSKLLNESTCVTSGGASKGLWRAFSTFPAYPQQLHLSNVSSPKIAAKLVELNDWKLLEKNTGSASERAQEFLAENF